MDDVKVRHKKELKGLEGEKRNAIKKAKATAGKKAKALIASLETEYSEKLKMMEERHKEELSRGESPDASATPTESEPGETIDADQAEKERKQEKMRKKRAKQREKEKQREQEIAEEAAKAGPSPRDVENKVIQQQLTPLNMKISEVAADGHCLYRAVAAQTNSDYQSTRRLCAQTLETHEVDFSPFCEYSDSIPDFSSYVESVRSSAEWGGHIELRALSIAMKRAVLVYSVQSREPLTIAENGCDTENPIRLSYHLQYYALGEHYNQVVPNHSNDQ